ncbi:MAG TPA: hypothetical protein PLB87_05795, partial [Prolixibacteraceae bacterium]|nr:hypothetical protein [Prolixibacteraceae bacterium]
MMKKYAILTCFYLLILLISCKKEEVSGSLDDSVILDNLVTKIENNQYGGEVHSLLIMKDDSII